MERPPEKSKGNQQAESNTTKPSLALLVSFGMEQKGWSQTDLAESANVSQSLVSNLLRSRRRSYKLESLQRIADALDMESIPLIEASTQQPAESDLDEELEFLWDKIKELPNHSKIQARNALATIVRQSEMRKSQN
ncbi:hypothetical protein A2870_04565 [Candidatus Curtissbacteria bacterium RIFCSPHIGHO2_01_FULL_41_11]|uniref:HTH cro/C1-type domain-containing protein n=1 Tax=Candidatus Curtissbacteria bacterium RIFCSPHIGHO2_01_FULL_41_11 TaxID=1797711 RepID=A0A1F5G8C1_9BACT|nr:MAG: hypothetical protein A2870_04565 [Candidatus Curtissbacteria bacterium RIFCSPHIGHO2_01_FULL_41_11]